MSRSFEQIVEDYQKHVAQGDPQEDTDSHDGVLMRKVSIAIKLAYFNLGLRF